MRGMLRTDRHMDIIACFYSDPLVALFALYWTFDCAGNDEKEVLHAGVTVKRNIDVGWDRSYQHTDVTVFIFGRCQKFQRRSEKFDDSTDGRILLKPSNLLFC